MKATKKALALLLVLTLLLAMGGAARAAEEKTYLTVADMAAPTPQAKAKVILDTDMWFMGDDAICLAMLVNSGVIDLLGVTTVIGNVWIQEGLNYTLRELELLGHPEIPVYEGINRPLMGDRSVIERALTMKYAASGHGSLSNAQPEGGYLDIGYAPAGNPTIQPAKGNAVDFIVETVKANPGEVSILAIGPCTNLAMAIRKNPEIVPLVKQVIYMGGAIDVAGNTTPAAEFNFYVDPHAAKICLTAPFPRQVLVPLDVCLKAFIDQTVSTASPSTNRPRPTPKCTRRWRAAPLSTIRTRKTWSTTRSPPCC